MKFLEKNLEDIIFNTKNEKLRERGLHIVGKKKRQVAVGNYGILDIVTLTRPYYHSLHGEICKGTVTVFELKKDIIGISTFLQAISYLRGIRSYFEQRGIEGNYNYEIVLIGSSVELNNSFIYLFDFLENYSYENKLHDEIIFSLKGYTYLYEFDGIYFNSIEGYHLTNDGFKFKPNQKKY